jgi:hypothetical protein
MRGGWLEDPPGAHPPAGGAGPSSGGGAVEAEACQRRGPTILEQSAAGAGPREAQANSEQRSSDRKQAEVQACCQRGGLLPKVCARGAGPPPEQST